MKVIGAQYKIVIMIPLSLPNTQPAPKTCCPQGIQAYPTASFPLCFLQKVIMKCMVSLLMEILFGYKIYVFMHSCNR